MTLRMFHDFVPARFLVKLSVLMCDIFLHTSASRFRISKSPIMIYSPARITVPGNGHSIKTCISSFIETTLRTTARGQAPRIFCFRQEHYTTQDLEADCVAAEF